MNVLIDDGLSTLQQLGGIGYFSVSLWKHLKKYIDCDLTDYRYLKGLPRAVRRTIYLGLANLESHRSRYQIIHYQNYYVPRFSGKAKRVTTVHDLAGLKSPESYPSWYNIYFRNTLRNAVKRSDAITLPSHAAAKELVSLFPNIDSSRVYVCHHGIRSIFFTSRPEESDVVSLKLKPFSYFLFIGTLEKRKNLKFLLSQFIAAQKDSRISRDTKLVLVGKLGIGYADFKDLVSDQNNIVHLGRLSDEYIVSLYKFCKALVFPSLYEGFGVPIPEAMSQNSPIVISDIPSSVEFNHRHNNQCFVFELGRQDTLIEMLAHIDRQYAQIIPRLNYGDLSMYSYDRV
ncbi:MAG TPA: glycosyltransferase family 1 protein, partial [Bacteroidota bacterium]|nr:glycosyltransferase family 1 protein [Bacteroidota bacterium]